MPELAAIIARLEPELGSLEGDPQPLDGGITNRNYRVRMGGEDLVLRVCDHGAEVLGIDRTTEEIASRAPRRSASPRRWSPSSATSRARHALAARRRPHPRAGALARIMAQVAGLLRRLHATPALPTAFAVFRLVEDQRELATAVPDSYEDSLALSRRIEAALTGPEHVPVSCHNDLLTANFVRDGARVCIVDWEYAGMNNRYFDLGNLSSQRLRGRRRPRAARAVLRGAGHRAALRHAAAHAARSPTSARRCGASSSTAARRWTSTTPRTRRALRAARARRG
jgi:thiamine kinase-like enzyme